MELYIVVFQCFYSARLLSWKLFQSLLNHTHYDLICCYWLIVGIIGVIGGCGFVLPWVTVGGIAPVGFHYYESSQANSEWVEFFSHYR